MSENTKQNLMIALFPEVSNIWEPKVRILHGPVVVREAPIEKGHPGESRGFWRGGAWGRMKNPGVCRS